MNKGLNCEAFLVSYFNYIVFYLDRSIKSIGLRKSFMIDYIELYGENINLKGSVAKSETQKHYL